MSIEMVVAKYEEDVAWLSGWVDRVDRITVYDKSPTPTVSTHPKVRVVPLPNVGREAHTYAHHFLNVPDLCDTVVCTQGEYRDHMSDRDFEGVVLRGEEPNLVRGMDVRWHSTAMGHYGWTVDRNWAKAAPMTPAGCTAARFFVDHIADDLVPEDRLWWWQYGIFAVSRDDVRRVPPDAWRRILGATGVCGNPEVSHYMERFFRPLLTPKESWDRVRKDGFLGFTD